MHLLKNVGSNDSDYESVNIFAENKSIVASDCPDERGDVGKD